MKVLIIENPFDSGVVNTKTVQGFINKQLEDNILDCFVIDIKFNNKRIWVFYTEREEYARK